MGGGGAGGTSSLIVVNVDYQYTLKRIKLILRIVANCMAAQADLSI